MVKIYQKKNNFEFHLENIKWLKEDSNKLLKIKGFPKKNYYYSRRDKSGWWMATKQVIIRKYIGAYLNILEKQSDIDLYFIDLMSSWGMNKVTKRNGSHKFIFPGTSISAALKSQSKSKGFTEFYFNDADPKKREILKKRLDAINSSDHQKQIYNINTEEKEIDSNEWVLSVMREIEAKSNFKNYLMVIDNQGLNIHFDTIKKIREINEYGDLIINFQDFGIGRQIHNKPLIRDFFGKELPTTTKRKDLCLIYTDQLEEIGFGRIEKIPIETSNSYYYTLLFCCRKKVSSWLRMIEKYRDDRFKSWTDLEVKRMWEIVTKRIKPLSEFP